MRSTRSPSVVPRDGLRVQHARMGHTHVDGVLLPCQAVQHADADAVHACSVAFSQIGGLRRKVCILCMSTEVARPC